MTMPVCHSRKWLKHWARRKTMCRNARPATAGWTRWICSISRTCTDDLSVFSYRPILSPSSGSAWRRHGRKRFAQHCGATHRQRSAIAPVGMDWGWKHNYYCVTPYYVQFKPDETGKGWKWPDQIDPWLYNLPANLLAVSVPLEFDGGKLGQRERKQIDTSQQRSKYLMFIDPKHSTPNTCPRKK